MKIVSYLYSNFNQTQLHMLENQHLLHQLEQLLRQKRSKRFYAEKLGISEDDVSDLLEELRKKEIVVNDAEVGNYIGELEDQVVRFFEDVEKGTGEVVFNSKEEIRSLDDLIEKCKIDTSKWEITKYIQNYWGNKASPCWQVKAWLGKKKDSQVFQDAFVSFLENYQPSSPEIIAPKYDEKKRDGCLILNKQDAHHNKYDIIGDNDIDLRFEDIAHKVGIILEQAKLTSNLEEITYIVGSDEFNSEFNSATTKGTPQQNILPYHESFEKICEHEVRMIELLLQSCTTLNVIYVAGNHDEFVGWHMINWLKTFFRNEDRVFFDCHPRYRKYVSYGNSAIMFNHGDAIKPAKLAAIFPMEFKGFWSAHENFYIFTGDKHHEVSQDIHGIKFYQIPAFSNARSLWDDKNGHICSRAEVTAFLIDHTYGMTNIFKQYL